MKIIAEKNGKITKIVLAQLSDISYSALMKCLRNKDVKINGNRVKEDLNICAGDEIEIFYKPIVKEKYSLIFEDENIVVINKKSGYTSEEVFNSIKEKYFNCGFIHRLDRNTSGIMVFSLNSIAENELLLGFRNRTFDKKYLATVYGKMPKKADILTAYLVKDKENSTVKIFDREVNDSVLIKTGYEVLKEDGETSLIKVTLFTGKTHQIRAHLSHIGHFIIGDGKYGDNKINKKLGVNNQMLVASELTLKFDKNSPLFYLNGKTFCIGK